MFSNVFEPAKPEAGVHSYVHRLRPETSNSHCRLPPRVPGLSPGAPEHLACPLPVRQRGEIRRRRRRRAPNGLEHIWKIQASAPNVRLIFTFVYVLFLLSLRLDLRLNR